MFGQETLSLGRHIALGLLVFEHIQINIFSDPFLFHLSFIISQRTLSIFILFVGG